jgi:prepilin-type N-terminal cleavage/methylation domain-containing protein
MTRPTCHLPVSRGFTLTEILIVIGIIVLMIALAVPALGLLTGSRSIDRAENNVSAMLGRARADAIGVQKDVGVLFFIDPATELVTLAEVRAVDGPTVAGIDVWLDLTPDQDWLTLPKGVLSQTIDNADIAAAAPTVRVTDAYLGYNTDTTGTPTVVQYGGVILFDFQGQLVSRSYGFRGAAAAGGATQLSSLLMTKQIGTAGAPTADIIPKNAPAPLRSQFGLVLMDREEFNNNADLPDAQVTATTYATREKGEEDWIDGNSVPLIINRYNGTLVRGE